MWNFVLGVLAAIALGVVVDVLTGGTTATLRRLRMRVASRRATGYDARVDGLYMLAEWSPLRRLEPGRLEARFLNADERPEQPWVEPRLLAREVAECRSTFTGNIAYLTGIRVDHRESEETQVCRVIYAPSEYAEVQAVERLRARDPDSLRVADLALRENPLEFASTAIPSSFAVNMVPMTEDRDLFCARRSAAVDSGVGIWTVGVFETMKWQEQNAPGQVEDFFALAYRALEEELGLRPQDCDDIHITWVGLYRPIFRGHLTAFTRLRLSKAEVTERVKNSDSSYEHDAHTWVRLNKSLMQKFAAADATTSRQAGVSKVLTVAGKDWAEHSRLAVNEAWRYRLALDEER